VFSVASVSLRAPLFASVTTLPAVPCAASARFAAVAAAFEAALGVLVALGVVDLVLQW
jgi:hypothetical protein